MSSEARARRAFTVTVTIGVLALLAPGTALAVGDISGTVTAEIGGAPVAAYEVEAYTIGGTTPVMSTCTAGNGTYTIAGLAAGTYEVFFSGDGGTCTQGTFAREWFNARFIRTFADPVVVTDGGIATAINATLFAGAQINGTVTDNATAAALQNVTVDLLTTDNTAIRTACTAVNGTYSLTQAAPLPYTVRFNANGSCGNAGNFALQWYNNSPSQAGATLVAPFTGETINSVNAALVAPVPRNLTVSVAGTGTGSVTSNVGGIACPGTCNGTFTQGDSVTLTAVASPNSAFTGWSGAGCSGAAPCVVTMSVDQAVTATFNATSPGGGGGGGGGAGAPNTKIDQAKIVAKKGKATFAFSGSGGTAPLGFECALVQKNAAPKFASCGSPKFYKKLKKGKYTFHVRARDASGKVDGSPATASFKSKKKKR